MIEELQMLKEIFGELTSAGIWGLSIYVGYKLLVFFAGLAVFVYIAKLIIEKVYSYVTGGMTKEEHEQQIKRLKYDIDAAVTAKNHAITAKNQAEAKEREVKSMYKVLKQKHGGSDD